MKTVTMTIQLDVDDSFEDQTRRWEHHIEELLDLDAYPEIRSVHDVKVNMPGGQKGD